jgi:hypothetical protein
MQQIIARQSKTAMKKYFDKGEEMVMISPMSVDLVDVVGVMAALKMRILNVDLTR